MNSQLKLIFGLILIGGTSAARGWAEDSPSLHTSGWLVYWDLEGGGKSAQNSLDDICLFAYHFDAEGHLVPASAAVAGQLPVLKAAQTQGRPRVWLTVVNDRIAKNSVVLKDPSVIHHVLADPEARRRHIQELLQVSEKADGLEIDYENLDPADRGAFTQFLNELVVGLHARSQRLSVVVEPRTEEQERVEGPGAMDWANLSKPADRVRVMAYFLHYGGGPAGPTAPPEWVDQIVAFAKARIPPEKLDVAFCLDGIDWEKDKAGSELTYDDIEARRMKYEKKRERSAKGQPPHFSYTEGKSVHQVWYEDTESLLEKIRRLRGAGVQNVSFWRLGTGDPRFWQWLAAQKDNAKSKTKL